MTDHITARAFHEADGVQDWRVISEGACTYFHTGSYSAGARLVAAISELEGLDDHGPDIDLRRDGVTVRLITITDDYYGMSARDVELARRISAVGRGLGFTPDPSVVQTVLVIPGASDIADIVPFWRAALGYVPRGDSPKADLVDPRDRGPAFWFEGMDEPRSEEGGAIHIAVWVPIEEAEARVAAALAAGGHIVRDEHAPAWWTLADSAGNEADIATVKYRD